MLTAAVFLPLAGALIIAVALRNPRTIRGFAVTVTVADLILAILIFSLYDQNKAGLQLVEQANWVAPLNVQYFLGLDGLNAPLVLLTGLLGMCAAFASWNIKLRVREYFVWLLVLQTAVMGVFVGGYRLMVPLSNVWLTLVPVVAGAIVYGMLLLKLDQSIHDELRAIVVQMGVQWPRWL